MNFPNAFRRRSLMVKAGVIVLIFVGFSLLWIPITDRILGWLVQDPVQLTRLSTYKGTLYIGIVALFLFWLVLSALERAQKEAAGKGSEAAAEPRTVWGPLALFLAGTLVFGGLGYVIYRSQRDTFERQALVELADHARLQVQQIEDWLQERRADVLATAQDPLLLGELQRLAGNPGAGHQTLDHRLRTLNDIYHYKAVRIVDPRGRMIASSDGAELLPVEREALAGADPITLAWAVRARDGQEPEVQASYCAVIPGASGPQGVLMFRLNLDKLLAQALVAPPSSRTSMETLLVCRQGTDMVFLRPARLSGLPVVSVPLSRTELVGVQALSAGEGTFRGVDYRSVPSIAVSKRLDSLPWVLLSKVDTAELNVPIRRLSSIYGGVGLLFLALCGIALFIWRKREQDRAQAERHHIQTENRLLEYRLDFMQQHTNDAVLLLDPDGRIRQANERAVHSYGYPLEELLGMDIRALRASEDLEGLATQLATVLEVGSARFETLHRRKDGSTFPVEVSSRTLILEETPCLHSVIRDISDRRRSEQALRQSGERYRRLFDEAVEGIVLADFVADEIVDCNQAFQLLTGWAREQVVGASLAKFYAPTQLQELRGHLQAVLDGTAAPAPQGCRLLRASGAEKHIEVKFSRIELEGRFLALGFFRDLTEERQREFERETTLSLLRLLHEGNRTHELIGNLTGFIQAWSGCEAVGIRLRDGEDFPYFETRGFPAEFVEKERSLCARDPQGQLLRDPQGHPVLDCMCGNILCGRFNPAQPFFTAKGSFWTNGTTALLTSTTEEDRQAGTRNRCNAEGYESVALIPLRSGAEVFGLLQLNDRARDRFTPERIAFLEGVGDQIALALSKRQALEAMEHSEQRLRHLSEAAGEFLWETGPDGTFTYVSDRIMEILGYKPEELLGRDPYDFVVFAEAEHLRALADEARDFKNRELPLLAKSGGVVWVSLTRVLKQDAQGGDAGYFGAGMDITERKEAERDLRESEEKFSKAFRKSPILVSLSSLEQGILLDVNDEFCRLLEWEREELIGHSVAELGLWLDPELRSHIAAGLQERGFERDLEVQVRSKTGKLLTLLWSAELLTIKEQPCLLASAVDITERNAMRLEAERNRQLLKQVLDTLPIPVFGKDLEGRYFLCNRAFPELLGLREEEVLGRTAFEIAPRHLAETYQKYDLELLQAGSIQPYEAVVETSAGPRQILFTKNLMRNPAGVATGQVGALLDITERRRAEDALRESEQRVRAKLDAILAPEGDLGTLELADILDGPALQQLMDHFYRFTRIGVGIIDLKGQVLVGTGWQDICTRFHRTHPEANQYCLESDLSLSSGLEPGTFRMYKCKNNLWDIATPIQVGGRHVGNLFLGQFFFEDEVPDLEVFRAQARRFGFDEAEYLVALERIPRWSRATVDAVMGFYARFSKLVSELSYSTIKLARSLAERERADAALAQLAARLHTLLDTIPDLVWLKDPEGVYLQCNRRFERFYGVPEERIVGRTDYDFVDRSLADFFRQHDSRAIEAGGPVLNEEEVTFAADGHREHLETIKTPVFGEDGSLLGVLGIGRDITERRRMEEILKQSEERFRNAIMGAPFPIMIHAEGGEVLTVNEAWTGASGYTWEDLPDFSTWLRRAYGESDAYVQGLIDKLYASESRTEEGDFHIRAKDGTDRIWDFASAPLGRLPDGRRTLIAMARDVTRQRAAEAALKASEAQYRRLFDTMKEGFALHEILTDETGRPVDYRFLEVNPAFEEMTGISRERWLGHTVMELLPLTEPHWIEVYGRVALTGEAARIEDHSAVLGRWFEVFAFSPAPRQFAVLASDITERKQAELALQKSARFLQEAQRVGHIGCYSLDILSGRWESSESLDEIFGIGPSYPRDVQGWLGLIPEESRDAMEAYLQDQILIRGRFDYDYRILRANDGQERWVSGLGEFDFDESGRPVRMLGTIADITEWKQAELDLFSKSELLRLTGSMAKVGGWELDPRTLKGSWTDEVAIIHDLDPRAKSSMEISLNMYTPGSRKRIEAALAEALSAGKPYDLELEIVSAKGVRKDVRTLGLPITDDAGHVVKVRGIFQDITERKAAEAVILRMTEELEQRVQERTAQLEATNQELEAFSYSVSHDLRGPLRGVDGFSRALLEDYHDRLDDTGRHYLARIRGGTQRMGQLIDDLLKLSRIGRSDLVRMPVDVSALGRKVLEELAQASPERKVATVVQDGLRVHADRRLLQVVLENLLGNAWKFTTRSEAARIEVGETPDHAFYVRDNGAGFDMAYAHKLFNAFQRLHTEHEFEGTGIGLAIVQRIVHRHGGRIWVEAEPQKGATFYFTLPERGEP